jgi:hypothetical protein
LLASDLIDKIYRALPKSRTCNLPSTFFAVAGHTGPRWILPSGPNLHPLLASWSPYRLGSRLLWRGILAAQKVGAIGMLPGVERVKLDDLPGIHWPGLGWRNNTPPVPVVYVGTPGPRQKAVLHLVDPATGQCSAVIKIPLLPSSRAAIIQEATTLAALQEESCQVAPRLTYFDNLRAISTQRFLAGNPGSRKFLPEYQELIESLLLREEHTTIAGHAAEWQDHPLWDFMERPALELLTSAFSEQFDATSLPAWWEHGDFAPWNIRDRSNLRPALIDWEMGQRGALPLQDAFHFLYIQQFLFGGHQTSHSANLAYLAQRIGIPTSLCRKLEIAYLTRSYFTCMEWEDRGRAEALLMSLSTVMRQRARSTVFGGDDRRWRLVTSRPGNHRATRFELLSALIGELNSAGVPYCILSGHENTQETHTSDVDIMFRPSDQKRIPGLLARCAAATGSQLVQAIRHETSACYFVLAKAQGKHVAHLAIDCYGDYRRDDRTWLLAEQVIANRRKYRNFYRPSVPDEFLYRLIKNVLKQSLSTQRMTHLRQLFARDPSACRNRLTRFWPEETAVQIERALMQGDLAWFREHLPSLGEALSRSPNVEGPLTRLSTWVHNAARLLTRILFPTGMHLSVPLDEEMRGGEFADRLLSSLSPAFRRTQGLPLPVSFTQSVMQHFRVHVARMRSTLVIETTDGDSKRLPKLMFGAGVAHLLFGPDLILRAAATDGWVNARINQDEIRPTRYPRSDASWERELEQANVAVLNWLAARTAKRLGIARPAPETPARSVGALAEPPVECELAGLD